MTRLQQALLNTDWMDEEEWEEPKENKIDLEKTLEMSSLVTI
jgi:hypothetical protein